MTNKDDKERTHHSTCRLWYQYTSGVRPNTVSHLFIKISLLTVWGKAHQILDNRLWLSSSEECAITRAARWTGAFHNPPFQSSPFTDLKVFKPCLHEWISNEMEHPECNYKTAFKDHMWELRFWHQFSDTENQPDHPLKIRISKNFTTECAWGEVTSAPAGCLWFECLII